MRHRGKVLSGGIVVLLIAVVWWTLRGGSIAGLDVRRTSDAPIRPGDPGWETTVQVRSLGVAGWLVRRGDDAFLTGPLYSFPRAWRLLGLGPVVASKEAFEARHPQDEPGVRAILVGHAHYDHALYVPLALQEHEEALAYGSATLAHLLAGFGLKDRAVPLEGLVDSRNGAPSPSGDRCPTIPRQDGTWVDVPGGRMRIRAFTSHHPAQVLGLWHLWPGCLDADLATEPRWASDWVEGPVFSYLVDFLGEDGRPEYRVFFQDCPSDDGTGQVPEEILSERAVDLALVGAGNWDRTRNPESIIPNLKPRHVVLHHWENFFHADPRADLRRLPLHDIAEYRRRVRRELDLLGGERTLVLTAPDVLLRYDGPQ